MNNRDRKKSISICTGNTHIFPAIRVSRPRLAGRAWKTNIITYYAWTEMFTRVQAVRTKCNKYAHLQVWYIRRRGAFVSAYVIKYNLSKKKHYTSCIGANRRKGLFRLSPPKMSIAPPLPKHLPTFFNSWLMKDKQFHF